MIVTDIAPLDSKKRKVYIDGQYAFPLYISEIRKYRLESGCDIDDSTYCEIEKLIVNRIKERILYLTTDYDRTKSNIVTKLKSSGYNIEHINAAVEVLEDAHIIDDERYAGYYAESLRDNKGKSKREIALKLYEKGISKDIIDKILDSFEIDDSEQVIRALRKKGLSPEEFSKLDYDEKRKITAYLYRKGFSMDTIHNILDINIEIS